MVMASPKDPECPSGKSPLSDARHRGAIRSLAQELELPADVVAARYEELLSGLLPHASVVDYLPMLVTKQLRKVFKSHI